MQYSMLRASLVPTAAASLVLAVSGCGSGTKTTPTLAQFAAQANEICVTLTAQQESIEARFRGLERAGWSTNKASAALWRESVLVSRVADAKVDGLRRPPSQAATIAQLVVGYFEEAADENNISNAYASQDVAAAQVAGQAFLRLAKRDAAVARTRGMTDCAKA